MKYLIFILAIATNIIFVQNIFAQDSSKAQRQPIRPYFTNKNIGKSSKFKLAQLEGRWQEINRTNNKTKDEIDFTDTTYLRFYDGNKVDTKEGTSLVVTGFAEITKGDFITTSANDFKIISIASDAIVLDDQAGLLHQFAKKEKFSYEIIQQKKVAIDSAKNVIDLSAPSLINNWFAYRRGANPGFITNETALIRNLKITEKTNENIYTGEIEFAQHGTALIKPCTINIANNTATITADNIVWKVEIYKCDGKELIFGKQGELMYYFKNTK